MLARWPGAYAIGTVAMKSLHGARYTAVYLRLNHLIYHVCNLIAQIRLMVEAEKHNLQSYFCTVVTRD